MNRTTRYLYDEIDRLLEVKKPDAKQYITYLDGSNTKIFTDENGNATAYSYDGRNRMTTYSLNGTQLLTNKYQFSGPRYEKKETAHRGVLFFE